MAEMLWQRIHEIFIYIVFIDLLPVSRSTNTSLSDDLEYKSQEKTKLEQALQTIQELRMEIEVLKAIWTATLVYCYFLPFFYIHTYIHTPVGKSCYC